MTYASPNITSSTSPFVDLGLYVNSLTYGYFWSVMLLCLFVILFVAFRAYGAFRALASTGYIVSVIAILMRVIGFVDTWTVVICIAITAIATVLMITLNEE